MQEEQVHLHGWPHPLPILYMESSGTGMLLELEQWQQHKEQKKRKVKQRNEGKRNKEKERKKEKRKRKKEKEKKKKKKKEQEWNEGSRAHASCKCRTIWQCGTSKRRWSVLMIQAEKLCYGNPRVELDLNLSIHRGYGVELWTVYTIIGLVELGLLVCKSLHFIMDNCLPILVTVPDPGSVGRKNASQQDDE